MRVKGKHEEVKQRAARDYADGKRANQNPYREIGSESWIIWACHYGTIMLGDILEGKCDNKGKR